MTGDDDKKRPSGSMECNSLLDLLTSCSSEPLRNDHYGYASPTFHILPLFAYDVEDEGRGNDVAEDDTNGGLFLVVARTTKTCAAQVRSTVGTSDDVDGGSDPILVWSVNGSDVDDDDDEKEEEEEEEITCAVLLEDRPIDNLADSPTTTRNVSVVLGTSLGRVLCVELKIHGYRNSRRVDIDVNDELLLEGPYEPLPRATGHQMESALEDHHMDSSRHSFQSALSDSIHGTLRRVSGRTVSPKKHTPSVPSHQWDPYAKHGSVSSLSIYQKNLEENGAVWVAYTDGTCVRLPRCYFFRNPFVRTHRPPPRKTVVVIPCADDGKTAVLPIPIFCEADHASLFATPRLEGDDDAGWHEAVCYGGEGSTLDFYSSEDISIDPNATIRNDNDSYNVTRLVKGVLNYSLPWNWSSGKTDLTAAASVQENSSPLKNSPNEDGTPLKFCPEPARSTSLSLCLRDPPRRVTATSISPDGKLLAACDTLGRVILLETSTKQVLRMWKGVRDALCYWLQYPIHEGRRLKKKKGLFLVIHARQRGVMEVWKMRHGSRVLFMGELGRDAQVLQCTGDSVRCFLLGSNDNNGGVCIKPVVLDKTLLSDNIPKPSRSSIPRSLSVASLSSMDMNDSIATDTDLHLQLLQQLLSPHTNITNPEAVFSSLCQITSVADLSTALNKLSTASHLEDGMGIKGSSFHTRCVGYCSDKLDVLKDELSFHDHPDLSQFRRTVGYHERLIAAYDVLRKFETEMEGNDREEEEEESGTVAPRSVWSVEALAWIDAYEAIMEDQDDKDKESDTFTATPMKFHSFARCCTPSSSVTSSSIVVFCDSTKDRRTVLLRVLRPLLKDIFVFSVVHSVFDKMGIIQNYALLQQYFGEWFLALHNHQMAARASLFRTWCPVLRWLQEITSSSLNEETNLTDDSQQSLIPLRSLYEFCENAEDLPRAFLLAAVCREAVWIATERKEAKTYGMISSGRCVRPWDDLLRKLRVCLLFSLRLKGVLPPAPLPLTVSNLHAGDVFSVYQWLARDEILIYLKHDEILAMEDACRTSPHALDPSGEEGDRGAQESQKFQNSCQRMRRSGDLGGPEQASTNPLLLFFPRFNRPSFLAAHRALLLGEQFSSNPKELQVLRDIIAAMKYLGANGDYVDIAAAVRVEVWQVRIRPVYRAIFYGFEDVPELDEEVLSDLLSDEKWMGVFSDLALEILTLLEKTIHVPKDGLLIHGDDDDAICPDDDHHTGGGLWPPVTPDFILKNTVERSRHHPIRPTSLDFHRGIVCAVKLTDDLGTLEPCIPAHLDLFHASSLFVDSDHSTDEDEHSQDYQLNFLLAALERKAVSASEPVVDYSEIQDVETLARTWNVLSSKAVRSHFLLDMYELGKDAMVEDLITSGGMMLAANTDARRSQHKIDSAILVDGGMKIACKRLNATITMLKKVKQFRGIVGMLDADTCQWLQEQSRSGRSKGFFAMGAMGKNDKDLPSISATHVFVMKLLRMTTLSPSEISFGAASAESKDPRSEKIHAMCVLSGMIVNAMESER